MGQSTNAILFWGFSNDDEGRMWDDEDHDEDAEERYARVCGVTEPSGAFPAQEDKSPEAEAFRAKMHAYWKAKRELTEQSGCEIDSHCSGDYPIYYVHINGSQTTAYRGDVEEITDLDVGGDWEEKLREYCKVMGIKWQEPGWFLVSYWG